MTRDDVIAALKAKADPAIAAQHIRHGASEEALGVKMGDIRAVAKAAKGDHDLGLHLWQSGPYEARMAAILLLKPSGLSADDVERMIGENRVIPVSDWFNSYVLKKHKEKQTLRQRWERAGDAMLARAYWSLTAERVSKAPDGFDLAALLDRLEVEMPGADPAPQWTMNNTLAAIGINAPAHRARALEIGERLGIYRDYPTAKGCTSPYAPLWINEMVSRAG
ncbi:DNA alkylation repair protein [Pseudoroseicyclus sp. H15]